MKGTAVIETMIDKVMDNINRKELALSNAIQSGMDETTINRLSDELDKVDNELTKLDTMVMKKRRY
jgi:predicted short-subunit dehydrogenase-like oxidoreductase (DUF2520 family)